MPDRKENEISRSNPAYLNQLNVLDAAGQPVAFSKLVIECCEMNNAFSAIIQLSNIDILRQTEPAIAGQLATVLEYNPDTEMGGGVFIYDARDNSTPEDYGVTIVTPGGKRWKRAVGDYSSLTVAEFGAVDNAEFDSTGAVKRMYSWTQKNLPALGIRFPAGTYKITSFDISDQYVSKFRLSGAQVDFGYFPATTLVSDQENGEVMFTVKARFTEISGLIINGRTNEIANTKGFFKNIIDGGQYLRVSSMDFCHMGGRGLDLLDTLDCKIDQWYASYCSDTVIYATWSGRTDGKWDHITAIELANFNIQYSTGPAAIDLQRATQSIIRNGWIEHTENPGDISNGQWIIEALSIEDCRQPLSCHFTRAITLQKNIHGTHGLDFSEQGDRWLSEYETGDITLANHGVVINGSLNADYVTGQHHMDNRRDTSAWFLLGEVQMPGTGSQVHMRLVGSQTWNTPHNTQTGFTTATPEGGASLYLQAGNDNIIGSWYGYGSAPMKRLYLEKVTGNTARLYLLLPPYSGYNVVLTETNCVDHFQAGVSFLFRKRFELCDAVKSAQLDSEPDNSWHQHWQGNASVGFGFNNDNQLLLHGQTSPSTDFDTAGLCLNVMVNGKPYGIALTPLKP